MSGRRFFTLLFITLGIAIGIAILFNFLESTSQYFHFSLFTIIVFGIMSLGLFLLGKRSAQSTNKYQFVYLVILNILLKIFASVIIIVVYNQLFDPPDRYFVIPFMCIYILFTIFETLIMVKLSRLKPAIKNNG